MASSSHGVGTRQPGLRTTPAPARHPAPLLAPAARATRLALLVAIVLFAAAGVYVAGSRGGSKAPPAGARAAGGPVGTLAGPVVDGPHGRRATRRRDGADCRVGELDGCRAGLRTARRVDRAALRRHADAVRSEPRAPHAARGLERRWRGGWTYGDQITPREIHLVVAAFNGGFKLTYPTSVSCPAATSRSR